MLRHKTKVQWVLISVFLMVTLFSGSFMFKRDHNVREYVHFVPQKLKMTTEALSLSSAASPSRYVTKSLLELGKMDEINKHILLINQVPYCGGEILIFLLEKLQGANSYKHVRLKGSQQRGRLSKLQQEHFVDYLYDIVRNKAVPLSLDRQIRFINFTIFDKQSPTYVNIIRHPADKILSRSIYGNKNNEFVQCLIKKTKCEPDANHLTIPYFCGQDDRCLTNPDWALKTAKDNVEKYYPVVGILDELNATLEVLEDKIPFYFKGVQELYKKHMLDKFKEKKHDGLLKQSMRDIKRIKKQLPHEFDFYEWAKSRLFQQLQIIYGDHQGH